jgi:colanic acid biosynthesis glycosyl transferase WcaI
MRPHAAEDFINQNKHHFQIMKILLHGINFAPELTGIGKYTGEMATWLAKAGHEVRVVTAPPYYPEWKIWGEYRSRPKVETWEGVQVFRSAVWVPRNPTGSKRLLHLASFAISSLPLMLRQLKWKPDIVWVVEPPLFCAPTALCTARLSGARAWLHVQDYEVDAAFSLGLIKGRLARKMVSSVERWLMRRFDQVSTISSRMMERASSKGVASERLTYFPNWTDLDQIRPLCRSSRYRTELGIPEDAVVALYSGNMGGKQGLEMLAQAAHLLSRQENLYFVFCGSGAAKPELMAAVAGLARVQFLDLQPLGQLNELLGMADIHLLPQRPDAEDLVMPSKLTGMLASGRAVVATAREGTELYTVLKPRGVVVPPGDPVSLAEAIMALADSPLRRRSLGVAGRRYAETHFAKSWILNGFIDNANSLCDPDRGGTHERHQGVSGKRPAASGGERSSFREGPWTIPD